MFRRPANTSRSGRPPGSTDPTRRTAPIRGYMESRTTLAVAADGGQRFRTVPQAYVPIFPPLAFGNLKLRQRRPAPSVLDTGSVTGVLAARFAIALALQHSKIGAGDEVLMPAFHCPGMVDPIVWQGATPRFYKVLGDLTPDLDDLKAKLGPRTKAVVGVHYFGFPIDFTALAELCSGAGIRLIEDCAHCFFGEVAGRPVGAFGDYAVASPRKFFSIANGGYLVTRDDLHLRAAHHGAQLRDELAFLAAVLDLAVKYDRFSLLRPALDGARSMRRLLRPWRRGVAMPRPAATPDTADLLESEFSREQIGASLPQVASLLMRWEDFATIAERRRANYREICQALTDIPGVRPLVPEPPEGAVPFMVPLVVDDLTAKFGMLEDRAIPMQRFGQFLWKSMEVSDCAVTRRMSETLVQLPCHQGLTSRELAWLVSSFRDAFRSDW